MIKKAVKKSNGNVFKTVVRSVIKEEIERVEKRLEANLDKRLEVTEERVDQKIDATFRKYRDETLTKMGEVVGELKTTREEQAAEAMLRQELEERVDGLESIHPEGKHAN